MPTEASLPGMPFEGYWSSLSRRSERDAAFASTAGGLVVLRAIDAWTAGDSPLSWGAGGAGSMLHDGDDSLVAKALRRLVNAVARSRVPADARRELFAYGRALEKEASYSLAIDVYVLLLKVLEEEASVLRGWTEVRLGRCYLVLNCLELAENAFTRARTTAASCGVSSLRLLSLMASARLQLVRGNIPAALQLVERVLDASEQIANPWIRSRAFHEAMNIEQYRGNFRRSIDYGIVALRLCAEPTERHRVVIDLGLSLVQLECFEIASALLRQVAIHTQEEVVRWAAWINLAETASLTGDREEFDRLVERLSGLPLPPHLAASFKYELGKALFRFGDVENARKHLRYAIALAAEHGFYLLLNDCEQLVKANRERETPSQSRAKSSEDFRATLCSLTELCESGLLAAR